MRVFTTSNGVVVAAAHAPAVPPMTKSSKMVGCTRLCVHVCVCVCADDAQNLCACVYMCAGSAQNQCACVCTLVLPLLASPRRACSIQHYSACRGLYKVARNHCCMDTQVHLTWRSLCIRQYSVRAVSYTANLTAMSGASSSKVGRNPCAGRLYVKGLLKILVCVCACVSVRACVCARMCVCLICVCVHMCVIWFLQLFICLDPCALTHEYIEL